MAGAQTCVMTRLQTSLLATSSRNRMGTDLVPKSLESISGHHGRRYRLPRRMTRAGSPRAGLHCSPSRQNFGARTAARKSTGLLAAAANTKSDRATTPPRAPNAEHADQNKQRPWLKHRRGNYRRLHCRHTGAAEREAHRTAWRVTADNDRGIERARHGRIKSISERATVADRQVDWRRATTSATRDERR